MNKTETALVKREIKTLKSALNKRQKEASKAIAERRKQIRAHEVWITSIERDTTAFEKSTNDRLAVLQGRLNS